MKKIAIFHPSSELYGADRILVNALKTLPDHVEKHVYLKFQGPMVEYLENQVPNVEITVTPYMPIIYRKIFTPLGIINFILSYLIFALFFIREMNQHKFKSIYYNTMSVSFIAPFIWLFGIPSFIHVHEIIDKPKIIGLLTTKISYLFTKKVICVSWAVKRNLLIYQKDRKNRFLVIHNGIDQIQIRTKVTNDSVLQFYLFGRIMPKKGQWFLLDSLKSIPCRELRKAHFTLVGGVLKGDEFLLDNLKEQLNDLGLKEYVSIKGFTNSIADPMSKADVCLVPSLMKDPFPTTVLEAMSAGRPVIATNHGGAKEAVVDGRTGFLVDPNNVKQLSDSIRIMIENKETVDQMGKEAKILFRRHYTMEIFRSNWLKVQFQNNFI